MSDIYLWQSAVYGDGESVKPWPLADAIGMLAMCRFKIAEGVRGSRSNHGATLLHDVYALCGRQFYRYEDALPFLEERAAEAKAEAKARAARWKVRG